MKGWWVVVVQVSAVALYEAAGVRVAGAAVLQRGGVHLRESREEVPEDRRRSRGAGLPGGAEEGHADDEPRRPQVRRAVHPELRLRRIREGRQGGKYSLILTGTCPHPLCFSLDLDFPTIDKYF